MTVPRYAELRCRSAFSFLRGASHPEELVERAAELGLAGLALTDADGLYGVVRAHARARKVGLPLLVGAEVACADLSHGPIAGPSPLVLLAMDREGYAGLCRLLSELHCGDLPRGDEEAPARRERPALAFAQVAARARGLFALYPGADAAAAEKLRDAFGRRRTALAVARHHVAGEEARIGAARSIGQRLGLQVAVVNDVHTHDRARQPLQDVLTCVRLGTTVERAGRRIFPNAERTLKGPEEMAQLWPDFPEGLAAAAGIAEACRFRLDEIRGEHPLPPVLAAPAAGPQVAGMELLRALVEEGARWRWKGAPPADVQRQIARELELVEQLGYASYFLTVWDIVRFARERGVLCQGRGSAANSVLCYCLGITSIDPVRMGLLFERFISVERGEPPDIDVDFEHARREEVLQYVYQRYGRDHAGMVCEVISYRGRSALRDVGKALGLALPQVERLTRLIGPYEDLAAVTPEVLAQAGLLPAPSACPQGRLRAPPSRSAPRPQRGGSISPPAPPDGGASPAVRQVLRLARELLGLPRHLAIHVGGFVITRRPLCETAPIEPAAMPGRTIVQWDKDDIAELGLLKVDLLGLGMLTALSRCLSLLAAHHPAPAPPDAGAATGAGGPGSWPSNLAEIPAEDPAVYAMASRADTIGVFQIESRAQMGLLPRLKPRRFYDLVISVAIIRPGPIQGGMVHPYLRRRDGLEPVRYPYAPLGPVLERTLGVPLFQEQAMRLAVVAAGFTPGEADELRRVMTHKRSHERMEAMKARLVSGMAARSIPQADAEEIFRQLLGFAGYGFPESHAASFALLVYASAWLKRYHPAAFACALLDAQPMGFYAPHTLVEDAKRHGVEVRGVDVTCSDWTCTLEGPEPGRPAREGERAALRLGLGLVRGLQRTVGEAVVAARREAPFESLADLARRARVSQAWLERLAQAGALRGLEVQRRRALWGALAVGNGAAGGDLVAGAPLEEPPAPLPDPTASEEVAADYATTGLSEKAHPMAVLRPTLARRQVRTARELVRLRDRDPVEVAGLVIVRQRPETASGLVFVSLEDETGIANLVLMPDVYERHRALVRGAPYLLAQGRVERNGLVVNVRVRALAPLPVADPVAVQAHDFH